jgi:porin
MGQHTCPASGLACGRYRIHDRKYTDVFTNASFGWPAGLSLNIPSGGPSPPLATMGARLRADLSDNLTLIGAIFDGNAAGPGIDTASISASMTRRWFLGRCNSSGIAKKVFPASTANSSLAAGATLAISATSGLTVLGCRSPSHLALPPQALPVTSDYTRYSSKSFAALAMTTIVASEYSGVSYSPPDRNVIDVYADGGVEFIGLDDKRPHDKIGVAAGYAHASSRVQALDADFQQILGPAWPVRSFEALVTAVYQYEVRDGWTLQPNVQ